MIRVLICYPFLICIVVLLPDLVKKAMIEDALHKRRDATFTIWFLTKMLANKKPFRSIFYWRVRNAFLDDNKRLPGVLSLFLLKVISIVFPELDTVEISVNSGSIGGDFCLPHGHCIINAERIGSHVSILQGVTIGRDLKGARPVIDDNVIIYPNTVIVGDCHIGHNTFIGAGCFVNYDVPPYSTLKSAKANIYEWNSESKKLV